MTKKYTPKSQYKLQSDLPQSGGKLDAEFSAVSDSTDKIDKWIERSDLDANTGRLKANKVSHHNLAPDLLRYLTDTANGDSEQNRADAQAASVSANASARKAKEDADRSEAAYGQVSGEAARASEFADAASQSQVSAEVAKNSSVSYAEKSSNSANHSEEDANRASLNNVSSANWAEYLAGPVPLTSASYLPNETPESVRHGYFSARWWAHEAERRVTEGTSGTGAGMIISANEPKGVITGTQWLDSTTARVWIWDDSKWLEFPAGGDGGGVFVSEVEPADPFEGMLWMDSATAQIWIRDGGKWLEFPASGSGGGMIIASEQPNNAEAGTQWLDTTTGKVWIWDGLRWLEFPASSTGGSGGMIITDNEPVDAEHGTQWLESSTGRVWIRDSGKWLEFPASCFPESGSGGGGGTGAGMVISASEPAVREDGMQWLESGTSIVWIWDNDKWLEFPVSATYSDSDSGGIVGPITTQQVLTVPDVMFRDAQGRFKSTKNVPELSNQMEVNRWVFEQLDELDLPEMSSEATADTLVLRDSNANAKFNLITAKNFTMNQPTISSNTADTWFLSGGETSNHGVKKNDAAGMRSSLNVYSKDEVDSLAGGGGIVIEAVREPRYQGGSATLELNLANNFTMDFSTGAGYIIGLSGAPSGAGDAYGFTLTLDTTNMAGVSWDDKIKWSGGAAPTLTADTTYVFTFLSTDGGTTFKGFVGGEGFA